MVGGIIVKKKLEKAWTLEPGQRYLLDKKLERIIDTYHSENQGKNILISNQHEDGIYFMILNSDGTVIDADVALLFQDDYSFLQKEKALTLTQSYMRYMRLLGEAINQLEEESDQP
jgi:hypothetical protein